MGNQARTGTIITLFSARTGTGKTTIAINLAVALAQETGQRVALVDLDVRFGDVAIFMDIPVERSLADLVALGDEIATSTLEQCVYVHRTGVSVLPAPVGPTEWRKIEAQHVQRIVSLLAESYDLVVLDTPDTFNDIVVCALKMATDVALICTADDKTLDNTRQAIDYLRSESLLDKTKLVVNSINERSDTEPQHIQRIMGVDVFSSVPYDRNISGATQFGTPLVASNPNSKAALRTARLAYMLAGLLPVGERGANARQASSLDSKILKDVRRVNVARLTADEHTDIEESCRCRHDTTGHRWYHPRQDREWEQCSLREECWSDDEDVICGRKRVCTVCECMEFSPVGECPICKGPVFTRGAVYCSASCTPEAPIYFPAFGGGVGEALPKAASAKLECNSCGRELTSEDLEFHEVAEDDDLEFYDGLLSCKQCEELPEIEEYASVGGKEDTSAVEMAPAAPAPQSAPEQAVAVVGVAVATVATIVFTILGFLWIWSAVGPGAAILAAIFLWTIPATLGYWIGVAVVAPFAVALGLIQKAQGPK